MHTIQRDRTIIFLHLPRSAGATLNRVLFQYYPSEAILKVGGKTHAETVEEVIANPQARMITGHYPFGLHTVIHRPSTYITMLREPVGRFVSHYYSAKYNPRHHLHSAVSSGSLSMRDAVPLLANIVTRYFAGDKAPSASEKLDASVFKAAKENLERHFAFLGLAEAFDESVVLLQRQLGWKVRSFDDSNVNRSRPAEEHPDPTDLDFFREHNALDLALYAWAKEQFEREIEAQDSSFQWQLRELCFRRSASTFAGKLRRAFRSPRLQTAPAK